MRDLTRLLAPESNDGTDQQLHELRSFCAVTTGIPNHTLLQSVSLGEVWFGGVTGDIGRFSAIRTPPRGRVAVGLGDPLVRLRARPAPPYASKALSRDRVAQILRSDVPLRERVLWHLLYESSARAEEVLMLDVPELDTGNRCAVVTRGR